MTGPDKNDDYLTLADSFVEDILTASDEEILREATEDYGDPKKNSDEMRSLFEKVLVQRGKQRMESARARLQSQCRPVARVFAIPKDQKRRIIDSLKTHAQNNGIRLTIAARKEEELSDVDIDAKLEAFLELGLIDEQGNLK